MIKLLAVFLGLGALFAPASASAFPELARDGYVNCTSCHVSPSGGGVLTTYGRQLSGDLLSTWSNEGESDFIYGLAKEPDWLNAGGDARGVYLYRNTPQVWETRFVLMQADLEAAATYGKFTADVSAGYYMSAFESRQFYLDYRPSDELSFRVGKFRQAYGLMDPDHSTPIHRGLGWDEGTETYNVEAAWLGEKFNAYVTANFGPLGSGLMPLDQQERGAALRVGVPFLDRFQVGGSYFHGVSEDWNRDVFGPWAILGFTKQFFLLSEIDFQDFTAGANQVTGQNGWVTWNRLDYELIQGVHGYLQYELDRPAFADPGTQTSAWGPGAQWFPRPHCEADLYWLFQSDPAFPGQTLDYAVLLLHYYL